MTLKASLYSHDIILVLLVTSLYNHDIILFLFQWIIKQDYKEKLVTEDWSQSIY